MFEFWAAILMGWPSALAGTVFLVLGLVMRKAWVLGIGAILSAGFCAYIAMNPLPFRFLGLLAFAGNAASVVAVHRRRLSIAGLCLVPFIGIIGYLVYAVRAS